MERRRRGLTGPQRRGDTCLMRPRSLLMVPLAVSAGLALLSLLSTPATTFPRATTTAAALGPRAPLYETRKDARHPIEPRKYPHDERPPRPRMQLPDEPWAPPRQRLDPPPPPSHPPPAAPREQQQQHQQHQHQHHQHQHQQYQQQQQQQQQYQPPSTPPLHLRATPSTGARRKHENHTIPIFVKLHLVGSTTLTERLRCLSAASGIKGGAASGTPAATAATAAAAAAFPAGGDSYWNERSCGSEQGHEAAVAFAKAGTKGLRCCVAPRLLALGRVRVRYVALLREPVEKLLSCVYSFAASSLSKPHRRFLLETSPGNMTFDQVRLLARATFGGGGAAAEAREYGADMITMVRGHFHETRAVFKSAARLRTAGFVVGVTEAYDSFAVLLALELGESR